MKSACQLLEDYDGNIHKASIGPPSKDDLITAQKLENQTNEKNMKVYTDLCMSLYSTCVDSNLHWRHSKLLLYKYEFLINNQSNKYSIFFS